MASTVNDIHLIGTAAGRPAAASGNKGYLYTATDTNGGTTYRSNGSSWVQIAAGVSAGSAGSVANDTIWDAKGDLAVGTGADTAAKLTAGTNGYVLTADSTQTTGLKWAAASGGTSFGTPPLDVVTLDSTYGDHFAASSLDAKWTRRNNASPVEAFQQGAGQSWLLTDLWGGSNDKDYLQNAPSGDFEVQMKVIWADPSNAPFGPMIVDSTGAGLMFAQQNDGNFYLWTLASYLHTGLGGSIASRLSQAQTRAGALPIWLAIRKVGTTYTGRFSDNGIAWSSYSSSSTFSGTPAKIGFGRVASTTVVWAAIDWFNVV